MSAVLKAQSAIHPGNRLYRSRKRVNFMLLAISALALAFGLFWLVWILGTLLYEGGTALARATLYYQMTPPPGATAGWPMRSSAAC
jgi:phosphate transport system permease protein